MALRTALTLSESQISRMVQFVKRRAEGIESQRSTGWVGDRERYEKEWRDDFSWRSGDSAVFSKSNESMNMICSGIDYIGARLVQEVFGARPWFSADPRMPQGTDPELSQQIGRHLEWKLDTGQIHFPRIGEELIVKASVYGESVAKIAHERRAEKYERIASVLWDAEADAAVTGPDGGYVLEDAGLDVGVIPQEVVTEDDGAEDVSVGEDWSGQPYVFPKGHPEIAIGTVSEAGEVVLNERYSWRETILEEENVAYVGAMAFPLHYKEFLCPLNVPDIHRANFVGHLTSMRLSQIKAQIGATGDNEGGMGKYIEEALNRIKHDSSQPKGEAAKPLSGEGEEPLYDGDPSFRVLEAYFEFDARETGFPQRIFLLMAYDHDVPIYWDYIRNVTPDGRYPFEVMRLIPEEGRWYGISWFRKYEKAQTLIDKLLNQIVYRNALAANPIKFRRKEAVVQWQDDQPFEIGPDVVLDLNDGYSVQDALHAVVVPELDQQTKFLLETTIANWRTRSGISTATQGNFGEMPAESTAYGVRHIIASGDTTFSPMALRAKDGLERILQQVANFQYAYQDFNETYTYLEGDAQMVGELNVETVGGLKMDVRITMTNMRQAENLQRNQQAIGIFERFLQLPPQFQPVAAPLYSDIFKSLGIDNTKDYFDRVVEIVQQNQAAQAAQIDGGIDDTAGLNPGGGVAGEATDVEGGVSGGEGVPQ